MGDITHLGGSCWLGRGASLGFFGDDGPARPRSEVERGVFLSDNARVLLVGVGTLLDGGRFFLAGVGLLLKRGTVSQFRGADHKRALSLRWIWVRTKTGGSVRLLDQSTRARRNGGRDAPERVAELPLSPCVGLSFVKVRGKSREWMRGFAYLTFVSLRGFAVPCLKV